MGDIHASHKSVDPLATTLVPLVITLVPQRQYRPPNDTSFTSKGAILFSSIQDTRGIFLGDALYLKGPQDWKDEFMKVFGTATKVTLRIHVSSVACWIAGRIDDVSQTVARLWTY